MPSPAVLPTATSAPRSTATPAPTATATLAPNVAPQVEVLEFDGNVVESAVDLKTKVRPEEEFGTRVRGTDGDGNMAYLALAEEDGTVLARESCTPPQGRRCTVIIELVAEESPGRILEFYAIAVDARGEFSDRIRLQAETRSVSSGGGGGGGGSGGNSVVVTSTPTPVPVPVLTVSSDQATAGGFSLHKIVLDSAPNGISGFDITFTVEEPGVARIVSVTFSPEFDLNNEAIIQQQIGVTTGGSPSPAIHQVHLFAADATQSVGPGMVNVLFAVIELKAEPLPVGVSSQQTTLSLTSGLLGIQDDDDGKPVNALMVGGTLEVN